MFNTSKHPFTSLNLEIKDNKLKSKQKKRIPLHHSYKQYILAYSSSKIKMGGGYESR